ncbi:hypothetical protein HY932_01140 [Candidatus Falkowbacteria bacterium]|nr:hypothetical protein [Candidatus Falkowbacteria bacterium]
MTKNKFFVIATVMTILVLVIGVNFANAASLASKLKGRILLQVESKGEAWYIYPGNFKKYYLGKPADALDVMKKLGLGAKHETIIKYTVFPKGLWGKILLDVDDMGKAYYIYPVNGKGYYLGKPADALEVMRTLGLGITNANLATITSSDAAAPEVSVAPADSSTDTVELIKSKYSCAVCKSNEKCVAGKCTAIALEHKNVCGNFVCEEGESYDGKVAKSVGGTQCALDCSAPCTGEYCNSYAQIECACDEYDALAERHGCIASAKKCGNCGAMEKLFDSVLTIQTDVIKCLSDYFQYKPARVLYKVFYNPGEPCQSKSGCKGNEGGAAGPDYIMFPTINGFHQYGQILPIKASEVTADVHETTHYFLYQMLHGIPSWFHEAIAIQTNERLNCVSSQQSWGDYYLYEKEKGIGGINMADGNYLTYDYYRKLKKGQVSLSSKEKEDHYLTGTIFVMGLKDDYKCGFNCVKDIVIKLREKEQTNCMFGIGENCSVVNYGTTWGMFWLGNGDKEGGELAANKLIKATVEEVVGKSVEPLFDLLNIKY